jgi:hypothetical protein
MTELLIEDLGDTIDGWAAMVNGSVVCVATPRIATEAAARRNVRNLVARVGGNCGTCRGCPIGHETA